MRPCWNSYCWRRWPWLRLTPTAKEPAAKSEQGQIGGVPFHATRSPDRQLCSYIARLGQMVVATNSPQQLEKLRQVAAGNMRSIAKLPEYVFFRNRYPRADAAEDAFVFLSDATIRRWCGPRWRIASFAPHPRCGRNGRTTGRPARPAGGRRRPGRPVLHRSAYGRSGGSCAGPRRRQLVDAKHPGVPHAHRRDAAGESHEGRGPALRQLAPTPTSRTGAGPSIRSLCGSPCGRSVWRAT